MKISSADTLEGQRLVGANNVRQECAFERIPCTMSKDDLTFLKCYFGLLKKYPRSKLYSVGSKQGKYWNQWRHNWDMTV